MHDNSFELQHGPGMPTQSCGHGTWQIMLKRLGIVFVVLFPVTMIFYYSREKQAAESLTGCNINVSSLSSAVSQYRLKYDRYPPSVIRGESGESKHSWRILVVEFLDPDLYSKYKFNEPWDSDHNISLTTETPKWFACPSCPDIRKANFTTYFMVTNRKVIPLEAPQAELATTNDLNVYMVESKDYSIHWLQPFDIDVSDVNIDNNSGTKPTVTAWHHIGPQVVMTDGSINFLNVLLRVKPQSTSND